MKKDTDSPKFSLVICTLNREKFISECLESVAIQTFKDFELVFIDGFSTDRTVEIIKEFIKNHPEIKHKFVQSKPKGISNAFNVGIDNSTGEYILFLNSDDMLCENNSLERANQILIKNPYIRWLQGEVVFRVEKTDVRLPNKGVLKSLYPFLLSVQIPINQQNTFMHRDIFKRFGKFNEELKVRMDKDFFLRLLGKEDIYFVNEPFATFRIHSESQSVDIINTEFIDHFLYFYQEYGVIPFFSGIMYLFKFGKTVKRVPISTLRKKRMRLKLKPLRDVTNRTIQKLKGS